jgi:hypothetical protein
MNFVMPITLLQKKIWNFVLLSQNGLLKKVTILRMLNENLLYEVY